MTHTPCSGEDDPLLLVATDRYDQMQRLSRSIRRIWEAPDIHVRKDVAAMFAHVVEQSLQCRNFYPDIVIIDLVSCPQDACALFETVRSFASLRDAPVVALTATPCMDMRDALYDAGADLVVPWQNLDRRISDIAGLAIENWLNTDPEQDGLRTVG